MDNFDIQASLKRIDKRFTEQLTREERQKAIKQFRKVYAEQIAKLSMEVTKRQKVQQNLTRLNQKQMNGAKEIDQQLKKKMEKHDKNRQKRQQSKQKQYKMLEENWRRKLDDIIRKNKDKERQSFNKAQKIRQDVQQYWSKKGETAPLKEQSIKNQDKRLHANQYLSISKQQKHQLNRGRSSQTYYAGKKQQNKIHLVFPAVPNLKMNKVDFGMNRTLNQSVTGSSINEDIRSHIQKSIQNEKEQEQEKFQKIMWKLDKIQQTRKSVQAKIQKEIKEAKRIRQIRQNPEVIEANKKKYLEQMKMKARPCKKDGSKNNLTNSRSQSKTSLNASISKHLQSKKMISEHEFFERENNHENKMNRIKDTKINRMVRDAINLIKHQTLKQGL